MLSLYVFTIELCRWILEYWYIALPLAFLFSGDYNGNNSERDH